MKTVRFSKIGQNQICRFFCDEQFYSLTFVRISHSLAGKWIFWFCENLFLMDKLRTVGKKWLAIELDLHFLTLKKCTKGQSNRSILSKVIVLTNYKSTDTQPDIFTKTIFSGSEGLKTWTFNSICNWVFQEDNNPKHRICLCSEWKAQKGITTIDWTASLQMQIPLKIKN